MVNTLVQNMGDGDLVMTENLGTTDKSSSNSGQQACVMQKTTGLEQGVSPHGLRQVADNYTGCRMSPAPLRSGLASRRHLTEKTQ